MAERYIYISGEDRENLVKELPVEFEWFPGLSVKQKQRSIESLHNSAAQRYGISKEKILEISSKSPLSLGVSLSAFNLKFTNAKGIPASVESFFQGSKVFEQDGPFTQLYHATSRDAKRYPGLKESGGLLRFEWEGEIWDLEPKTAFYDWLYLKALDSNERLREEIMDYSAFTDIEFNPKKSINCQAASAALYVGLRKSGLLEEVLRDKRHFVEFLEKQGKRRRESLFD